MKSLQWIIFVAVVLVSNSSSHGAVVIGGTLLSPGDANQIETWLGEGQIKLTNIYTKVSGQNAFDFHAAVDDQGRTVSVMRVFDGVTTQLIGGYNPQSWTAFDGYHVTVLDADRTAFLFNFTGGSAIQRQNLNGEGTSGSGQYQTYNFFAQGPTFGAGEDLFVDSSMNTGYAKNFSYGGFSATDNILNGVASDSTFEVGSLEVFSVANVVPEPASLMVWGVMGLVGIGAIWQKRRASDRRLG